MKKWKFGVRKGYTLVELTLSIAFFTTIITLALTGFIGIFGIYNKAQSLTRTQEEARKAMDTITRDLRLTRSITSDAPAGILDGRCLDIAGRQIGYGLLFLPDKGYYVLARSSTSANPCTDYSNATLVTGSDVWSDKPALVGPFPPGARPFEISQVSGSSGSGPVAWQVRFGVYRGVSAPTMPGFSVTTDMFGAGTMLQSIVIARN